MRLCNIYFPSEELSRSVGRSAVWRGKFGAGSEGLSVPPLPLFVSGSAFLQLHIPTSGERCVGRITSLGSLRQPSAVAAASAPLSPVRTPHSSRPT